MAKDFQKFKHHHKNHIKEPSKTDYSTSNASMEDFTPDLNSATDIIEQGGILEHCYVSTYFLLQRYGYDSENRSCQRFLKSKLTEIYDNPFLFVTVEQNMQIIIISLVSLESQPASNFVGKESS